MQGQVYLSVIMVNCTFFCASASILIERNAIVKLFKFPGAIAILRSKRVSGILGRSEIRWQVINSTIVPLFKEFFFRCHCSIEVSKRIKNLGVKAKAGRRYEIQSLYPSCLKEFFFRCPY